MIVIHYSKLYNYLKKTDNRIKWLKIYLIFCKTNEETKTDICPNWKPFTCWKKSWNYCVCTKLSVTERRFHWFTNLKKIVSHSFDGRLADYRCKRKKIENVYNYNIWTLGLEILNRKETLSEQNNWEPRKMVSFFGLYRKTNQTKSDLWLSKYFRSVLYITYVDINQQRKYFSQIFKQPHMFFLLLFGLVGLLA